MRPKKLAAGLLSLVMLGCVKPLEIEVETQRAVVLSGVISNSQPQRSFLLYEGGGLADLHRPISAEGELYRDGELWAELLQVEPGRYLLAPGFNLEAGRSYHAVFRTEDGQIYRSRPEVLPEVQRSEAVGFRKDVRPLGVNSFGGPRNVEVVDVFAQITIPESQATPRYYRFQVDEAWAFRELAKPANQLAPGERDVIRTCYLRREEQENPSTLLSTDQLAPGRVDVLVTTQPIDESFEEKHYFNVYLHSITPSAFTYYGDILRLSQIEGSLYDEIPAAVRGNVYNEVDTSELVLGYVEFSLADTMRLALTPSDLREQIFSFCRPASGVTPCSSPPPRPPGDTTTYYCRCYDCDQIYGFSTLIRPAYWE
ncbi:MAG: DUF4249 family protein [Bacteroidota bacterium]